MKTLVVVVEGTLITYYFAILQLIDNKSKANSTTTATGSIIDHHQVTNEPDGGYGWIMDGCVGHVMRQS
jgi:hypothetical protein